MSKLVTNDNLKAYHAELAEHIKLLQRNTAYVLDDIVNYDGIALKCTTAGTTNTTKPNISALYVGDTYTDGTCVWTIVDLDKRGIDYWASSITYALNDQVVYDNKIYKCSTAHTSTSTFDATKWTEISAGGGGSIAEWTSGTSYSSGDLVINNNVLYKANTTTSTTWVDSEWDLIGTTFNTTSTYVQKIVTNIVAPYEMLLQVGDSNYCKPPIDVLKKTGGSDNVTLTLENYNNSSAYTGTSGFLKIENSKAKLYNYKEYPITPQTLSTIDIGVSDEIDFNEFYHTYGGVDVNTLASFHFDNDTTSDATGRIWTEQGTVSLDTSNKKFGAGSIYLDGSGYLTTAYDSAFDFGTGDFTIDFWWKQPISGSTYTGGDSGTILCAIPNGAFVLCQYDSSFSLFKANQGQQFAFSTNIRKTDGLFHHFAIVRSSGMMYLFIDGELKESSSHATSYTMLNSNIYIFGNSTSGGYKLLGNIDEFRISNVARWTLDFTPPQVYDYNITSLEVN